MKKRAVHLAGAMASREGTAHRWLIILRWVAVLGMISTTVIAEHLVPGLRTLPIFVAISAIALVNLAWSLAEKTRSWRPSVTWQVVLDVLALVPVLWYSGGISNPFASFIAFQIVLAGLLCSGRATMAIASLALLVIMALWLAPPLPLETARIGGSEVRKIGHFVSLTALSTFVGLFVLVYAKQLGELRQEGARNERLTMLGRLVGGLSHELNTPLATILLASKDLVAAGRELQASEITHLSKTIAEEAQRASDIIGVMRGHVRPDQFTDTLELKSFVTDFTQRELDRLGFDGERVIVAQEPVHLSVLTAGLCQVLSSVLTNAVEATAPLARRRIEVGVTLGDSQVEVSVRDNGPGISSEVLSHLGEPFQTTKGGQGGMGLGLYVSSTLARRMDALLRVESPEEGGTLVTLSLKRAASVFSVS
ncbi:MAG: sensor histidine kinase [Deltaproteobacteria bacterium]|nr:sensor histidine kinase [Deltaproteobacteria bacterium]